MVNYQNLIVFLTCLSLFILSPPQTCDAVLASCTPSSCGLLPNITAPFRLNTDPISCGNPKAELSCQDGVASIHIDSEKYYVKEIDYRFSSVRLSYILQKSNNSSNNNDDICKYFSPSTDEYMFWGEPYSLFYYWRSNKPISFVSCANPMQNPSLFTRVAECEEEGSGRHTYLKLGAIGPTDMDYSCTLDTVLATRWNFTTDLNNTSLSEIHKSLFYGFNVPWIYFMCRECSLGCSLGLNGQFICRKIHSWLYYRLSHVMESFKSTYGRPAAGALMIFMVVVVVVFAGVTIPLKIIVGFGVCTWVLMTYWDRSIIRRIIAIFFEVRFGIGFLCAMGFLIYTFRRRRMSAYEDIEGFLQSDNKLTPIRYSYSDIKKMTRGFREKLGEGGFGAVYKGKLRSGHHVAVKLLGKGKTKGQDFINEIGSIGRIHHVNVVKLVGYCAERSKRALIFDFMPNGSLEKYIFSRENTYILDWDTKFKIVVGVARGIEYLHRGCDIQILHFDIKPHNILLDDKFVPKVSDFGLAKLCSLEKDNVTMTAARGTIGYVAPELINRGIGAISYKADVYSYGMMLIEILGLNRELKGNIDESTKYFPSWIYESFNQGSSIEIDEGEENSGNGENEITRSLVRKMSIVALWCIQMNPNDRPSMNKVLQMLEDDLECLQIPEYPSRSTHIAINEEESWGTTSTDSISLLHCNNTTSIEIAIA